MSAIMGERGYHGTLPDGATGQWVCPHDHATMRLAYDCAKRVAASREQREGRTVEVTISAETPRGMFKRIKNTKEREAQVRTWHKQHDSHGRDVFLDAVAALHARSTGRIGEASDITRDAKCRECQDRYEKMILGAIAKQYSTSVDNLYPAYIEKACDEFYDTIANNRPINRVYHGFWDKTVYEYWDGSTATHHRSGRVTRTGPTPPRAIGFVPESISYEQ